MGLSALAGLVWSDEMRVGLLGQVRRVWLPRSSVKYDNVFPEDEGWG